MRRLPRRRDTGSVVRALFAATAIAALSVAWDASPAGAQTYALLLSASPDRGNPVPLDGQTVAGDIYVFTSPDVGVKRVRFWVDNTAMTGRATVVENGAPYDLGGTASDGSAQPYSTLQLANGTHSVTAAIERTSGGTEVITGFFTVANETASYALLVSTASDRSNPLPVEGATVAGNIYVFTSPDAGVQRVRFFLNDPMMTGSPYKIENGAPYDLAGTAGNGSAHPFDTTQLPNGDLVITAAVELTSGSTEVLSGTVSVANQVGGYALLVSTASDRSNPTALDGASVSGNIYVFTSPDAGVTRVRFFLDDPGMAGTPYRVETDVPFDFAATASDGSANPFNTAAIADGSHVITAAVDRTDGETTVLHGTFTVANNAPALAWSPTSVTLPVPEDGTTSTQVTLSATSGTAAFTLTEDASWLTVSPVTGSTPASVTLSVDAGGLAAGTYTTSVTATADGYASAALTVTLQVGDQQDPGASYALLVSTAPDRSSSGPLQGASVAGNIYVFTSPDAGVQRVLFYLDNTGMTGSPHQTENSAPYDFAGTAANNDANPFDTTQLADGSHIITAKIERTDGETTVLHGSFTVANQGPALAWSPNPLSLAVPEGGSTTAQVNLNTTTGTADFTITGAPSWLAVSPTTGSTPASIGLTVDAAGLSPGTFTATVTASAPGFSSGALTVNLTVGDPDGCQPLACQEILVALPYELDFDHDHGKILDGAGIGTGFTHIDWPSKGVGYIPENLAVDTSAGVLQITTTAGLSSRQVNSLDNALAVGIDAPNQISVISTTLIAPPQGTGNFEQAGLWFGVNEDNYVKLVVQSTSSGTIIQLLIEVNGSHGTTRNTSTLNLSDAEVQLALRADPNNQTVTGTYRINEGATQTVGSVVAPGEFFSFDGAGIDPRIGTRSFAGIFTSHRMGPAPLVYRFGRFSVEADVTLPSTFGDIAFERTSIPVTFPTSMAWGPDNRLYVTELFGKIRALTLDENKEVIGNEEITTLGSRLTLGIAIDPDSTPSNVVLWVSHSSPSLTAGVANSSTVSRLSGPGFTVKQDVITGLPRAIANHAVNSIHFGPDRRLYIAAGGSTGAGAANDANTEFKTRPEQPLSAALLVADVLAPGFQGDCASWVNDADGTADKNIPSSCDVRVYASGLRNAYDFVYHSNGFIYAPDNGLGVKGTFPHSPLPDCQGIVNYSTAFDPGAQPDWLYLLVEGGYYGHPNPARDECVFGDGHWQGVAPLPNWVGPIADLGKNRSANGTVEYMGEAFCGALQGNLLIANYSVGNNITRVRLSPDGLSVVGLENLIGDFKNPLPLALDPDGTIYVGETAANLVTALKPINIGCWWFGAPLPQAVLDAGGAGLNGKLYVVAGKTNTSHLTTLRIYDPVTDTWTTGPNLPGSGVENPAVVAHNGLLYVFGGSTAPFSGAVANAAVFNPATGTWAQLAPMPTARGGLTAQVINGLIYVVGGMDNNGSSLATVEIYNPSTNTWSAGPAMSTRRDNPGSAALGGKLYVFGGRIRNADGTVINATLDSVEMFDPATNQWSPRALMPTGRRTMVVGTLNGRAQVMGGEAAPGGNSFAQNEEYDPETDSWRQLAPMPTPRHGAAAGTIDGFVFVVGGGPKAGSSFTTVNEAFSLTP